MVEAMVHPRSFRSRRNDGKFDSLNLCFSRQVQPTADERWEECGCNVYECEWR